MKQLIKHLLALLFFFIVSQTAAHATWAHVPGTAASQASSGPASSVAVTTAGSVTVGNLLVVCISNYNASSSTITVADGTSGSNTYTQAVVQSTSKPATSAIFYCVVNTGGTLTITATLPATSYPSISVDEYSFTPGTISVVTIGTNSGTGGGAKTAGSLTFSNSNALAVANFSNDSAGQFFTVGTNFTQRATITASAAHNALFAEDWLNVTSSSSPVSPGASGSGGTWGGACALFYTTGDAGTSLSVSPTQVDPSTIGNVLTLTGVGTSWTPGTPGSPTFTASAGTITAQVIASTTSATLTYTAPAGGPVTLTDPGTSDTATLTINGALTSGTASTTSSGNTIATVTSTAATGGSGGYTYQWCRSTSSGFTPGSGNFVSGATSLTLNDTGLTNGTTYYYVLQSTDSDSVTVNSNQISAAPYAISFAVSPSTSGNGQSVTYTLTGTGTSWTNGTTFSISGVTGASITSQSCNGTSQIGTVIVSLDGTHTGTITFSNSTDADTATTAITLAVPGAPTSPKCIAGNGQNVIKWTAPTTGGALTSYTILRGSSPGTETSYVTGLTLTAYTDYALTNSTAYYYTVKAVNATGSGAASTEVSGTPVATGPCSPKNNLVSQDYFTSGSLAAGWAAALGNSECQLTGSPYYAEPVSTTGTYGQIWTGTTYPDNQISEATVQTLTSESGTSLQLLLRMSDGTSTANGYECLVTNGTMGVYRIDAGVATQLGSNTTGLTFASGDVWSFTAAGSNLAVYQNFNLVALPTCDTTYKSGSPGFQLASSVAITHAQVSSWRGYNLLQQDGAWSKQGIVNSLHISSDYGTPPSPIYMGCDSTSQILYEGNAKILSGTVYKAWLSIGQQTAGKVGYAESTDGINWTRYSSEPVLTGAATPAIWKQGSTYYLYGQSGAGTGHFYVYTSSDGITWGAGHDTGIGLGTTGQWDDNALWTFQPVAKIGSTYYALYSAWKATSLYHFYTGIATSTDLLNWTKDAADNPVVEGYSQQAVVNVNGTYYAWLILGDPNYGNYLNPCQMFRVQSTDLIHWTNPVRSVHSTQMNEGLNSTYGQVYPTSLVQVGNSTYMYYISAGQDSGTAGLYQVGLATIPIPLSQLVTGLEDGTANAVTDNFTSGTGPLSANWTTPSSMDALQIVSGPYCEPSNAGANQNGAAYTGTTFSPDQYSEVTVHNIGASGYVYPAVRMQTTGANFYYWRQHPGGARYIAKYVNGTSTTIATPKNNFTFNAGDVLRLEAIGSNPVVLKLYQNGYLIFTAYDRANTFTSGSPGISQYATTLSDSQISKWSGGNSNVIPAYVPPTPASSNGGVAIGFPSANVGAVSNTAAVGFPSAAIGF